MRPDVSTFILPTATWHMRLHHPQQTCPANSVYCVSLWSSVCSSEYVDQGRRRARWEGLLGHARTAISRPSVSLIRIQHARMHN